MPIYEEVTHRAGSLRAITELTEPAFTPLLPPFEHTLVVYLQDRTIDGKPRTSRRDSTYNTCPLLTIAEKLLFIRTYVEQNTIQEVQGQLFGMSQSSANTWIHLPHTVLNQALVHRDLPPGRNGDD